MDRLGRYEIRGELGRGGMGVVYKAWDPELEREVAIKSLRIEGAATAEQQEQVRERFFREARAAARLSHPGIVAVHDVLRDGDTAYIVMELIRGKDLGSVVSAGEVPPAGWAQRVLREAAAALDFAHRAGIVHRDIKPGNILIDDHGRVKIADFGIAKIGTGQTMTKPGVTVGTLGYMSPEQIRGENVDGRADQFSLAVLAYQLLTGSMPFEADSWIALSYKILSEHPEPPDVKNPAIGPAAAKAILRGLSKQPAERFTTCTELVQALCGETPSVPAPATKGRSRRVWWGVGAAVVVAAAGIGMLVPLRRQPEPIPAAASPPPPPSRPEPEAAVKPPENKGVSLAEGIDFVPIPAGVFQMGDAAAASEDQRPPHLVRITRPFQMGRYEVTRKQWSAVMGLPAPRPEEAELPASGISFEDAQRFLARLNAVRDGFRYRLPTEAEWEFAARAGERDSAVRNAEDVAWFHLNSGSQLHRVGDKLPNAWQLHDMLGNVWEWVADFYDPEFYGKSPRDDPQGPATGELRVLRGGGASTQGMMLTAAWRLAARPSERGEEYGLRIVRVAE